MKFTIPFAIVLLCALNAFALTEADGNIDGTSLAPSERKLLLGVGSKKLLWRLKKLLRKRKWVVKRILWTKKRLLWAKAKGKRHEVAKLTAKLHELKIRLSAIDHETHLVKAALVKLGHRF